MPALLTLLSDIQIDKENSHGPIGIIFAASSKEVDDIFDLCKQLVNLVKIKIVRAYGQWNCAKKQLELINGVHLLITTSPCFIRLVTQNDGLKIFDKNRIQHIVFDNYDYIYDKYKNDVVESLKLLTYGANNPEKNPQIIVTSSKWLDCINNMLKLSCQPLVIITYLFIDQL